MKAMELIEKGNEFRVGRKLGRTVYIMISNTPSDKDILIGMFDTVEIAKYVVAMLNACECNWE